MAYATHLTISTGNKVSLDYQSQEVSVTLTYQLERDDNNVLAVVREKASELAQAHQAAWQTLRDAKVAATGVTEIDAVGVGATEGDTAAQTHLAGARKQAAEATAAVTGTASPTPSGDPVAAQKGPHHTIVETSHIKQDSDEPPVTVEPMVAATPGQIAALALLLDQCGWSEERRQEYLRDCCTCESLEELTTQQAAQWLLELQRGLRLAAQEQRLMEASLNGNRTNYTRISS